VAQYTTAASSQGGYSTAQEELKKRKRQALLDANATPQPTTGGGPGGIVGPGGEYRDPSRYDLPSDLEASRRKAYENEILQSKMDVGANYASQRRLLSEQLARMGLGSSTGIRAGEEGRQAFNLALQEAGASNEAERKIRGQQSLEGLNWATGQRGFEQQQALQRGATGSAEKIAGMQTGTQKDIATMQAELQRQLQAGEITNQQYMQQRELLQRQAEGQQEYGFKYAELGQQAGLAEQQNQLARDLQAGTITNQQYMQAQQLLQDKAALAQQQSQFASQQGAIYGTYNPATGQYEGGLEREKMAQADQQYKQQYGYIDESGQFHAGTALKTQEALAASQNAFAESMAKYSAGYYDASGKYVPGVDEAQAKVKAERDAQLAGQMEQFKFDLSEQAKAQEAANSFYNEWIMTISKGTDKDKARDIYNYLSSLGIPQEQLDTMFTNIPTTAEGITDTDWEPFWRRGGR